jgi:hypothetical protein
MKIVTKLSLITVAMALVAVSAWAGAPVQGTYKEETGDLLIAHYAESFAAAGEYLTVGNAMNSQSWDGGTLGTQWWVSCPDIENPPNLVFDNVNILGNGQQIWQKTFAGGTFFMNGTGEAWDGGDATYTGVVDTYSETVTIIFTGFNRVAATSNVQWSGVFDNYPLSCISGIENGADLMGAKPASYPDYVDPDTCDPNRTFGRFGNHTDMTFSIIECAVPTEPSTWGKIKGLYK